MSSTPVIRLPDPPESFTREQRAWAMALIKAVELTLVSLRQPITPNQYTQTGTLTPTRDINTSAPTAANAAAVLATLLDDLKTRGLLS